MLQSLARRAISEFASKKTGTRRPRRRPTPKARRNQIVAKRATGLLKKAARRL